MADTKKLEELQEKISEQKSRLNEIRRTQQAESDPGRLVELKRTAASIENVIAALEHTYNVASYEPPEPTDAEILLAGVNAYVDAKQEKVQKVNDGIDKALAERREAETSLQAAVESGDADEVIKLSGQLEGIDEKLKYLKQMKEQTAALNIFPEGAVKREWEQVCLKKQDEWNALLLRIEVLASEYRKACDELLAMDGFLKNIRSSMQSIGRQDSAGMMDLPRILTVGLDVSPLIISKGDGNKLHQITNEFMSNRPL